MAADDEYALAHELLQHSRYPVALTGAGISTPSGVPDFRSPESGLWEKVDPFEVASLFGFRRRPKAFYDWIRPLIHISQSALPNPAHMALVKMAELDKLKAVITQNIDGLHSRAGSPRVIELHGHFRTATCLNCYRSTSGEALLEHLQLYSTAPTCGHCGGILKPDIIFFGEQLPVAAIQASYEEVRCCDLMLVAGSSLTVEPAASLPVMAKRGGANLIIINLQPTPMDHMADVVIHEDVAKVLPQLAHSLGNPH